MSKPRQVTLKLNKRELQLLAIIVIYTDNPGVMSLLSESTKKNFEEEGNSLSAKISEAWNSLDLSGQEKLKFKQLLLQVEKVNEQEDEIELEI
ncbi:MAG: hypothetical protein CMB80_05665 [Flammeovirgaceae bacterium]|nr:hypothetical protein [Flammeovirgaceae bacterium]|tara:strand:+ start:1272 stop:1550 length:279 start_codon:yes stop_codon:yes gene_type:complete